MMLRRCQKYTPKPTNIAKLKTAFKGLCYRVSIWNDLPQEFIDKAAYGNPVISRDFNRVLLQLYCYSEHFELFSLN